jgi:hypothetical protein
MFSKTSCAAKIVIDNYKSQDDLALPNQERSPKKMHENWLGDCFTGPQNTVEYN